MQRLSKYINVALVTMAFVVAWCFYYTWTLETPFLWKGDVVMSLLFILSYYFFISTYDGFEMEYNTVSESISAQLMSLIMADGFIFVAIFLLSRARFSSIIPFVLMMLSQVVVIVLWCVFYNKIYLSIHPPKSSIVVYEKDSSIANLVNEYGLGNRFKIDAITSIDEIKDDNTYISKYEVVFLNDIKSHDRNKILKYCISNGIIVYLVPSVGDTLLMGSDSVHMLNLPLLRIDNTSSDNLYLIMKRVFDILSALLLLIVISPLLLFMSIVIKSSDGGPIFYKQKRLTKDGKEFEIIKFRSMIIDAENDGVARLSSGEDDPRITSVGRFMRRYRIDELPQLVNIIKGDMSVVGPRPERPEFAAKIEQDLPEFKIRLQVKAGLTGYAQVYGRYSSNPKDKLLLDLIYIGHKNILLDLRIVFATILTMFKKKSSE